MQSRNPVFSRSRQSAGWGAPSPTPDQLRNMYDAPSYAPPTEPAFRAMTLDDVVVRSFMTLGTLVVAAAAAWYLDVSPGVAIGAAIVALILGLIVSFTQSSNPALILGYAAFEGVFLGTISSLFEGQISGIVIQAVLGTAMAFGGVLAVYTLRIVRVTPKMVRYVIAAAIAALGLILVNLVAGFFVPGGLGLRDGGTLAIVFSAAMILLGCFFLLLDFDSIEQGVKQGAPAKFAWQCAFGLTLSLVWIYLEVLRLLSYFTSSD
ncbi:Bax inhibitor-1/YccA family protein [Nonomuraea glycinis]|uniref:Membrane protein n=1 Tax=Nonomuraea glycinis TaxID=2047744 RepID=A0A918E8S8_9ACTN|nr:Bax inhibitor-1/YccA family protein [Nonomuraea glycinis]MCA2180600.1 Bax inhibitor-1/YccA family protein [Nonomuraea glycinis]GGP12101.1 membrane protein [Nonomuraea glycinis]